ncbi:MAG: DUF1918 domain-containing protein [Actinobacteria bacterium]|nr:DUF1918 domain-containing protein [Actinomycetota bacterium]
MKARPGNQLVVRGHRIGQPDRIGEVLETLGPNGTEPFRVRWDDDGHTTLFFPGTDCAVEQVRGDRKSPKQEVLQ